MGKYPKYSDPILREISLDILKLRKTKNIQESENIPVGSVFDLRYLFSRIIINTMIWRDPRLNRRIPHQKYLEFIEKIVKSIPESMRWKIAQIDKKTIKNLYTSNISELTKNEIEAINIEEKREIGLVAWYDSWKKKYVNLENIFKDIIQKVGVKNIIHLGKITIVPDKISKDPDKASKLIFQEKKIQEYISTYGANFNAFVLKKSDLENIRLEDYKYNFIPIFFERDDGYYQSEFRLMQANKIEGFCYAIPEAKTKIIDGAIKGKIFEQFMGSILTGNLVIETEDSKFFTSHVLFKNGNSYNKSNKKFYRTLYRNGSYGIKLRKRTYPSLRKLIYLLGETDIDLLLIQDNDPKHVLIGECCFTKKYNEDKYQIHYNRLNKINDFLNKHPETKIELGIPDGYPIVSILFTSFLGDIHKKINSIGKISFAATIMGGIEPLINKLLKKLIKI